MEFDFGSPDDSSDDGAVANISAWQAGAKTQRPTSPRRASGFQAVNQRSPADDIAMKSTPDPEPEALPRPQAAPVAHMQPVTEPTVISSGEDSSSDIESEHATEAPSAVPIDVEEEDDDIWATVGEVAEGFVTAEEDNVPQSHQSAMEDLQSGEEEHEEGNEDEDRESRSASTVEVFIPRGELSKKDRADCVDLTAGSDAVRGVLAEREDHDGMMEYTVEFEDYHVEQVRLTCAFRC